MNEVIGTHRLSTPTCEEEQAASRMAGGPRFETRRLTLQLWTKRNVVAYEGLPGQRRFN